MKIKYSKEPFGIHSSEFEFLNTPSHQLFGYNYPPEFAYAHDKPKKREIPEDDKIMNDLNQSKH